MDLATWDSSIDAFYREAFDEHDPARTVAAMRELLATMEADDAGALVPFEMAGVHDSLGLEDDAVPLYREAFLALALHSAGRPDEALREAIEGIVPNLTRYQRSLAGYAAALTDEHQN